MSDILTKDNIRDVYKLSPMQEGMYFHYLMDENSSAYFEQLSYRIQGELSIPTIKLSLQVLFDRYEVLRTVFNHKKAGQPLQVVLKHVPVDIRYIDLRDQPSLEEKEIIVETFKKEDKKKTFNLNREVLMRVCVIQLEDYSYEYIWSHHHILMDGWSVGILISEYNEIYHSLSQDRDYNLPHVRSYRTYIDWLQQQNKKDSEQYWSTYLKHYDQAFGVPVQKSNPAQTFVNEHCSLRLSQQKTTQLKALSAKHGVTQNILLQSIWGILLSKYNNTHDVVFGNIVSGRPSQLTGVLSMVGLFINAVPVRIQFEDSDTFASLLSRMHDQYIAGEPHHYYPLAEIQSNTSLNQRLLDHIFVFENYPIADKIQTNQSEEPLTEDSPKRPTPNQIPSFGVSKVEIFEQTNYDFNVVVIPREELLIDFRYNQQVYEREFILALAENFEHLVDQIISDSTTPIHQVAVLPITQQEALLESASNQIFPYPTTATIQQLFETQATLSPNARALTHREKTLTYSVLNTRANQLAHYLRSECGVTPNTRVALLMNRSEQLIIGILGILKSGGIYVPIDPAYPEERIQYSLEDSATTTIVLDDTVSPEPYHDYQTISTTDAALNDQPTTNPKTLNIPEDIAYIIYTSGSTGTPKGVMVTHRNLISLLFTENDPYDFGTEDVWTLFHSVCFDFSVWEIFGSLLHGGRLVIVDKLTAQSAEDFVNLLEAEQVTVLNQIPTMFGNVITEVLNRSDRVNLCLRYVIFGGEALNPAMLKDWHIQYPDTQLINMYGITETTVHVTYKEIGEEEIKSGQSNIGSPIPSLSVYIMDDHHELMPQGTIGEIVVGGSGVTKGYQNLEALTQERFIADPYHEGENLYCSGDLAMQLPNGELIYKGRKDHQVKIRGYRIELSEIELVLQQCQQVKQVVALTKKDASQNNFIVTYIVAMYAFNEEKIWEYLKSQLPEYMIPSLIMEIETIPLTITGKIDRKRLLEIDFNQMEVEIVPPRTAIDAKLIDIWKEVLDLESIGIEHHFFRIGGNSILAIKLYNKINQELGVSISLKSIFETFTVRGIADDIQKTHSIKGNFESGNKATTTHQRLKIVHLNKTFGLPSMFFSAPFGGILPSTSVIGIVDMVPYLKKTTSLFSIQAPPLIPQLLELIENEGEVILKNLEVNNTLEKMVDDAVHEIILLQGDVPYSLGGFCTGSVLSWEIANRLIKIGKKVKKLILIDPPVWVGKIKKEHIKIEYSKREIANFVALDLGWDTPAMDLEHLYKLLEAHPMRSVWNICNEYIRDIKMFSKTFDENEIRQAFERKFYNDLAIKYFFASRPYKYPNLVVEHTQIITTEDFVFDNSVIDNIVIKGDVEFSAIPYNHANLFSPNNLPHWIDLISEQSAVKVGI